MPDRGVRKCKSDYRRETKNALKKGGFRERDLENIDNMGKKNRKRGKSPEDGSTMRSKVGGTEIESSNKGGNEEAIMAKAREIQESDARIESPKTITRSKAEKPFQKEMKFKVKMIKIRGIMRYAEDIPEYQREKTEMVEEEDIRKIGLKIVEVTLIPSVRVKSNESNKLKIIKYCHEKDYKVDSAKNRGFDKLDVIFPNYKETNKCLDDKNE